MSDEECKELTKSCDSAIYKMKKLKMRFSPTLNASIKQLSMAKANSVSVEVDENPSPSGDKWFESPENLESVRRGIQEMSEGQGEAFTMDEIKRRLGV